MLWRDFRALQIYGANTDVGKTIISTLLCRALAQRGPRNSLLYLKPVSTGPDTEADDRHIKKFAPGTIAKCLRQYSQPLSPHLSAKADDPAQEINSRIGKLCAADRQFVNSVHHALEDHQNQGGRFAILETAGGVLSPGPSGTVQADLYRSLRLPVVLIGDAKLGGIATTISAFESLHLRGYDVDSVLLFDIPRWGNAEYLEKYFAHHDIPTFALPPPPEKAAEDHKDQQQLQEYYEETISQPNIKSLLDICQDKHFSRISKLTSMPVHAESIIWHPFRQYGLPQNVIAIDSAYEDHFQIYNQETDSSFSQGGDTVAGLKPLQSSTPSAPLLTPLFDASASWWTQGLGHGNPDLALTAANAAGRYGHVMFANAVHEPALDLCYNLLGALQNPRLSRVFFTDNGSTGMEVAVKMALRTTAQRYRWDDQDVELGIIGLRGSYHGDTIGVMNCSEPSPFNKKVDWYKPWGFWFSPPEVKLVKGQWQITLPADDSMPRASGSLTKFSSLRAIFDFASRQDDVDFYTEYIERTLSHLTHHEKRKFGALILEPLVMGAGGMIFVDPLFQRTLIKVIRSEPHLMNPAIEKGLQWKSSSSEWSGVPIVADEVFTGLYRLGRPSSASFWNLSEDTAVDIDISPDISCHAKLLTGGLLPLALTTASDSIFKTFLSDSKADALLHGHSYTAHAVGCAVANKSLKAISNLSATASSLQNSGTGRGDWDHYREAWSSLHQPDIFSFWSPIFLNTISHHQLIESCFAMGSVLVMTLRSTTAGYNSTAAASLQARLLTTMDDEGRGIHSRVLGNVIYFMTSMETPAEEVEKLEHTILRGLDAESAK